MRRLSISLAFLVAVPFAGCSFFRAQQAAPEARPSVILQGEVTRAERLAQGGGLLAVPFSAGVNVSADEELDRISLLIVKGFMEAFEEKTSLLRLLTDKDAGEADLILKGHVTRKTGSRRFRVWPFKAQTKVLGVEGEMVARETGERILTFRHEKKSRDAQSDFETLALELGKDIAKFVLQSDHPQ